jgi:hypothetical protein
MRVKHKKTGIIGTTVDDMVGSLACCTPEETPVVWDGIGALSGTPTENLEVIGPEESVANPEKCGAGRGADCCIFMAVSSTGFSCERFGALHWSLIFRKGQMNAKREPVEPYPNCQLT